MQAFLGNFMRDESGQGLVEYALIIALVSIALIASLTTLKNNINNVFNRIGTVLNAAS
jgi:pilus assembly protein Flp/PilA